MEGETLPPPAKMEDGTQPSAAKMEGETQPPPLPACVSKVLDDDNLLPEIIVRVGFPTSLVRAAAVCRRWLQLASDRAFLRRFRELYPPRLLGFYLAQSGYQHAAARFFSTLPQPPHPELAAVVRRTRFSLDFHEGERANIVGCWNGRLVTTVQSYIYDHNEIHKKIKFLVHRTLCSERDMAVIPALHLRFQEGNFCSYRQLFFKEKDDVLTFFYVMVESTDDGTKSTLHIHRLQNGDNVWRKHLTLAMDYTTLSGPKSVLIDNKIYMVSTRNEIVVLDLVVSNFSTIQLPQGVDFRRQGTTKLLRSDDVSGVYFMHLKEFQLQIWLHKGGKWLLMDNICLREMCAPFLEDEPTALLRINHVGDYTAEFLFLEMGRFALYLDVKCRTLRKVYEMARQDVSFGRIFPFMMIWPPIFPALKDGPASSATPPEEQGHIRHVRAQS